MAKLFGELVVGIAVACLESWANSLLKQMALKVCAWLDTKVHRRATRVVLGGLLGVAAYFLLPILAGLLSL
jgi:hypothetical protein